MSSSGNRHDAIVVGAGHNGLVAACYLARAGLDVLVLEKNAWVGGAAVSRKLYQDFTYSNCSYVCSLLRPEIMRELELPRFGLQIIPYDGGATMMRGGGHLSMYDNHDALRREIARHSRRDAEAYDRYVRDVLRQCRFIRPLLLRTPPDPTSFRPRDIRELLHLAGLFNGLGEARMYDTLRFWTMSCADFLDEYFENDLVKAHMAGSSIIGTALGPRSPGTAYVLLHHYMGGIDGTVGAWGFARGGMGAVSGALAKSFQASGGKIRTDAPVHRILVRGGRATGVVLESGEELQANLVVSNLDVKRTFLESMDARDLPDEFVQQVKRFKIRGSSGKLNIALDGLPRFPALPAGSPSLRGDLHVTDTIEMMERAYDDWKEGRWSRAPYIDMLIPSQIDPTMAPDGKHYMSVFVQYCPYRLADGEWTAEKRAAFGRTVIDTIAEHSPDFKSLILHAEVRTPWDIEREVGLTEGNIFQGELTFDQLLFNRPVPGYAQYRAPVRGMYMCGSSTHPGGGVMGAPGANAARTILEDLGESAVSAAHDFDCIIVGAGHNGLVCANYLARGGRRVLVLEAAAEVGGAAITREFAPGFRVSAGAHLLHAMPRTMIDELALGSHGLKLAAEDLLTEALSPDGAPLSLTAEGLAARATDDRAAWLELNARLQRFAQALAPVLAAPPPRLGTGERTDQWALLRLGWQIRRLGRRDMRELLRIGGMCVYDLLQENLSNPLLQGALGFDAVLGTNFGPRAPGTVFTWLYRLAAAAHAGRERPAQPRGGLGALSGALAASARAAGVTIRTSAAVRRIRVDADRAAGVTLDSGESISAGLVISNADPKTTFLGLLGSEHLDTGFVRRVAHLRTAGLAAKLHLALDRLPPIRGLDGDALGGRLLIAPSLDYIERAYNPSKYGECPTAPCIEITLPTVHDPQLAPAGAHVLSAVVQHVPYAVRGGWEQQRDALLAGIVECIEEYAPGLRRTIVAAELLTPEDLERQFRMTGGHWHHGELSLDQFFMVRPVPGAAQYSTPLAGLYLCGAGSHPGGGVMGTAGRNAARRILAEAA